MSFLLNWHISDIIWYLSLSNLLHLVWSSLGPSMLLQMALFHSFLWLSHIPLYICTTSSLSIHQDRLFFFKDGKTFFVWWLFLLIFNSSDTIFFNKFIYFIYFYLWLRWVFVAVRGLSLVAASGDHSSLRCVGFLLQRPLPLQSTGSRPAGFSSCGSRAQPLHVMWDLPRPGIEPASPALAGGFPTTAPPGWVIPPAGCRHLQSLSKFPFLILGPSLEYTVMVDR